MSDYTQEVRLSKEILARVVEAYRKIRNTLRYLSANLYDFDPAVDSVRSRADSKRSTLHPARHGKWRSGSCGHIKPTSMQG